MSTRADLPVGGPPGKEADKPTYINRRRGFVLVAYGVVMGPTATAIGALVSQRLNGVARITSWAIVTVALSAGAIFASESGLNILEWCFRSNRNH